jgi:hypothetical protein
MIDEELELQKKAFASATENLHQQTKIFKEATLTSQRQVSNAQVLNGALLLILTFFGFTFLISQISLKGEIKHNNKIECLSMYESTPITYEAYCK